MGVILGLAGRASESGGHPDIHRVDGNYTNRTVVFGASTTYTNAAGGVTVNHAYMLQAYGGDAATPLGLDIQMPAGAGNLIHWNHHNGPFRFVASADESVQVTNPAAGPGQTAYVTLIELS